VVFPAAPSHPLSEINKNIHTLHTILLKYSTSSVNLRAGSWERITKWCMNKNQLSIRICIVLFDYFTIAKQKLRFAPNEIKIDFCHQTHKTATNADKKKLKSTLLIRQSGKIFKKNSDYGHKKMTLRCPTATGLDPNSF
jgi:hypothetical protein